MVVSQQKWELDTQAYLNVCNITAELPRQQIRDFAKGINDLGLWNSMVCWPLRSSQNAGVVLTAYSLGGLGRFDGTLVGGPTWGADGIVFDGSDDRVTMTVPYSSIGCEFVDFTSSASIASAGLFDRSGTGLHYFRQSGGVYVFGIYNAGNNPVNSGISWTSFTRNRVACNYGSPGMSVSANGGAFSTNAYTGISQSPSSALILGFTQVYFNGIIRNFIHFDVQLSLPQIVAINALLP
jgi:hypothetical protein